MLIEEHLEKTREEEEKEERLANVTFLDQDREVKSIDHCRDDEITCDVTDQDREEKAYDPITDDETQVINIWKERLFDEENFFFLLNERLRFLFRAYDSQRSRRRTCTRNANATWRRILSSRSRKGRKESR